MQHLLRCVRRLQFGYFYICYSKISMYYKERPSLHKVLLQAPLYRRRQWTNAEGVTFTIRGAFEKDVLLKTAESVSAD